LCSALTVALSSALLSRHHVPLNDIGQIASAEVEAVDASW
jgi:hypothetical protein